MADEPQAPPEPSLAELVAAARERVAKLAAESILAGEDGPYLDLDLFERMLLQRAIECRKLNRELAYAELGMVRAEQDTQKVRADSDDEEAKRRLDVLHERERVILDQLWPLS